MDIGDLVNPTPKCALKIKDFNKLVCIDRVTEIVVPRNSCDSTTVS